MLQCSVYVDRTRLSSLASIAHYLYTPPVRSSIHHPYDMLSSVLCKN